MDVGIPSFGMVVERQRLWIKKRNSDHLKTRRIRDFLGFLMQVFHRLVSGFYDGESSVPEFEINIGVWGWRTKPFSRPKAYHFFSEPKNIKLILGRKARGLKGRWHEIFSPFLLSSILDQYFLCVCWLFRFCFGLVILIFNFQILILI